MNRINRRMARKDLATVEQLSRLVMFHQTQKFQQGLQEPQRRARDAVNQAVLESSGRCETALSME